jgi:hypothetical protein
MIFTYTRWVIFYEKSGLKVFKNNSEAISLRALIKTAGVLDPL